MLRSTTRRCFLWSLLLSGFVAAASPLAAETRLPAIFSDHMVLQRERPIPVWGWDAPGTNVTITLGDAKATATADANGRWQTSLPARAAGGPLKLVVHGTTTRSFDDVLIGEVWFCSGQSNMEWPVAASLDAKQEIASANHPKIRHIKIPHRPADAPQDDVKTPGWIVCSPKTVGSFTAAGYFFGRNLQQQLDVPIGLIGCNWGGTRIEPWTPPEGFRAVPELESIAKQLDKFPAKNKQGKINHQSPLALYYGMVCPVLPYGIRGAIWYQGESNNGEGMLYFEKMKALIRGWRTVWNDADLPFYFVQLAPFRYKGRPAEQLAGIWEAQLEAVKKIPHTGMAVTVDIGNVRNIHPKNKQEVGRRLALWALAKTYNRPIAVYSGPLYRSAKTEGSSIRISFDHTGSGLASRDGKPLAHFTIAGEDKKFVPAKATIDGDSVVVSCPAVAKPLAVRFAWRDDAEPNLSNKEGLPASPFRTDSW